ncbi:hypothetical protein ACETK8_20600 (plasmid) [Brevundimonas staleyi]|uniref:Uncharacterized protein n=1 Tax=Brevundimonas staleyi TaxID=74326 RepID=A0ABW0FQ45_9CAUL
MGKYDRLNAHLRRQKTPTYAMSLTHIEDVIGAMLPKGAARPEWWLAGADADTAPVQCQSWLRAGFTATLDSDREHVCFVRAPRPTDGATSTPSA